MGRNFSKSESVFRTKFHAVVIAVFLCCFFVSNVSEAVLFIQPTRMVFEGRDRSGTITVLNQQDKTVTYRLFWRDMGQTDEGRLVPLKEGDTNPWSAQHLMRYSPRQVTLSPQESQIIRFALRKPKDLKEGEYRSHLVIQEVPSDTEEEVPQDDNAPLGFKLKLSYEFSIPVIVEHGGFESKVTLKELETRKINEDEWEANAVIENTGEASPMGIIRLEWEDDTGTRVLAEGGTITVYLPRREHRLKLKYKKPDSPGRLRLAYYDDRHAKRKTAELPSKKLLAEAYLK